MTAHPRVVYLVHDLTTDAKPGIHATAYESIEKARANLDGFRDQHPDNPGPLAWSTGPGWAHARDAHGVEVFHVFGVSVQSDNEPAYYERPS